MSSTVVLVEFKAGQIPLKFSPNVWFIVGSRVGYSLSSKDVQVPIPIVCPPESATTSVAVKFLVARESRSWVVSLVGGGRFAKVSFMVAKLSPSLLPNGML